MASRPINLDLIDEAFAKILIEELADRDNADLGEDAPLETDAASQRWETIAALEVPAETNGGTPANGSARPVIRPAPAPVAADEPIPLEGVAVHTWQIFITYADGRQCTLPLESKPITLGRGQENAIVLKCEKVSRRHARIQVDDRGPRVDDLGSVNGILVNGIKVPAAYLKSGDIVRIGTIKVELKYAD